MGNKEHGAVGGSGKVGYDIKQMYISGSFQILHADPEQFLVGPGFAVTGLRGPGLKKASR